MKRSLITLVLLSGAVFAAEPQQSAAPAAAQGGPGERRQRPNPEQMAAKMMSGFDANKDSILSQEELTLALDDMHKNRPPRPAKSEEEGAGQSVQGEQRPEPPPADEAAARMIEKFSASKTGLTQEELTKALAERRGRQGGKREGRPSREDRPPRDAQAEE